MSQTNDDKKIKEVMKDLERKAEEEVKGLYKNNNIGEKEIMTILQNGSKEFEQKTGRSMSYGEMREMYG